MSTTRRYTSADLERLPEIEGVRYEIIDGELYVSKQPDWHHQLAVSMLTAALTTWSEATRAGVALGAPGLVFSPENDVAPDLIWISRERLAAVADASGHFRQAPELVVEVLSPGRRNEQRDREVKLSLYSRQGVDEYWIVDWRAHAVEVYRRAGAALQLVATLGNGDTLTSPLLPGFSCPVAKLWFEG
jgi:Uma2 family endonuclease